MNPLSKNWIIWSIGVILILLAGLFLVDYFTRASKTAQEQREIIAALKVQVADADAEKARLVALADDRERKANEFGAIAAQALAKVGAMDARVKALDKRLEALGPMKPATDTAAIPSDAPALAKRFQLAGLPPINVDPPANSGELAFNLNVARPMLGLVEDGKEYPKALESIGVLAEQNGTLKDQTKALSFTVGALQGESSELRGALTASKGALAECEKSGAAKDGIIGAKDEILKQTVKDAVKTKWRWGIKGATGGALVGALIVLLL